GGGAGGLRSRLLAAATGAALVSRAQPPPASRDGGTRLSLGAAHRHQQLVCAGRGGVADRLARPLAVLPQILSRHSVPAHARRVARDARTPERARLRPAARRQASRNTMFWRLRASCA